MRLLYVSSCHPTLEYNDLLLFSELGIECFSTGIYIDPKSPLPIHWRGPISTIESNPDLINQFKALNPLYASGLLVGYNRPHLKLTKEFVDNFDVVLCCSFTHYIMENWKVLKDKVVLWRTYSDETPQMELQMKSYVDCGVIPIRGTESELMIENSCGGKVIPCCVDEDYYKNWIGNEDCVLSFQNAFMIRQNEITGQSYLNLRNKLEPDVKFELYGDTVPVKHPLSLGLISPKDQLHKYQACKLYFSIGNHPAAVTYNFLEAWMTGCPVVTFGYKIGKVTQGGRNHCYEVPSYIENGKEAFYSDSLQELADYIQMLYNNNKLRKELSNAGRTKAISLFGSRVIKRKWVKFFQELGFNV